MPRHVIVGLEPCCHLAGELGYSAEGGAVDGGCSGWRAQVEQQAGHSHITNAGQILEIQI